MPQQFPIEQFPSALTTTFSRSAVLVATLLVASAGSQAAAQSPGVAELLASPPVRVFSSDGNVMGGTGSIRFGEAVALDGDLLAVGAPNEWGTGAPAATGNTGAVYIFARTGDTWVRTQKLRAPTETPQERFGASVGIARGEDLDGPLDVLVVGAPGFNANEGRAFVYHRRPGDLWQQVATFDSPSPNFSGNFGSSVSIDWFVPPNTVNGDPGFFIAVGAPTDRSPADPAGNSQRGSVSIFQRGGGPPTWGDALPFYGQDPDDQIGHAVALVGPDVIAAGTGIDIPSTGFNDGGAQSVRQQNFGGSGFFYALNWELQPSTAATGTGLGRSAALYWDTSDSGTAALGAPLDDTGGVFNRGKVYVYDLTPGGAGTTRIEVASVLGGADSIGPALGRSVALSRDLLLATSAGSDFRGQVEVFERGASKSDWNHVGAFDTPNGPSPFSPCEVDLEGTSIAIQDGTVAIGCTGGGSSLENDGVYVYFARRLFEDGFESGDTQAWSATVP